MVRRPFRRARRNRRRQRRSLVPFLLMVLIVEVVTVALKDPHFSVAGIEVEGCRVTTPQQVVRASGLVTGVNIFRTHFGPAQKALLALPPVAAVSLHRRLPACIRICIREREPLACVAAANGFFTMDAAGVVFRQDPAPPAKLPLVAGLEALSLHPGSKIPAAAAKSVAACIAAASKAPRQELARISIDQNGNLCFNTRDAGCEVRLGPPEQLPEKFSLLSALEDSRPDIRRDGEYIDLSCPEAPAWKPRLTSIAGGASG